MPPSITHSTGKVQVALVWVSEAAAGEYVVQILFLHFLPFECLQ